jgi:hypothetical protein
MAKTNNKIGRQASTTKGKQVKNMNANDRKTTSLKPAMLMACMALLAIAPGPVQAHNSQGKVNGALSAISASLTGHTGGLRVSWYGWLRRFIP